MNMGQAAEEMREKLQRIGALPPDPPDPLARTVSRVARLEAALRDIEWYDNGWASRRAKEALAEDGGGA